MALKLEAEQHEVQQELLLQEVEVFEQEFVEWVKLF